MRYDNDGDAEGAGQSLGGASFLSFVEMTSYATDVWDCCSMFRAVEVR